MAVNGGRGGGDDGDNDDEKGSFRSGLSSSWSGADTYLGSPLSARGIHRAVNGPSFLVRLAFANASRTRTLSRVLVNGMLARAPSVRRRCGSFVRRRPIAVAGRWLCYAARTGPSCLRR